MKILHTADLHLKTKDQISIVQTIVDLAHQERVDMIVIAGDLFDSMANGRVLETALLPIWEQFSGDILIVPGNHDYRYLKNRNELAPNVVIAHELPYSVAQIDGIYFVCVPYQSDISLSDIDLPKYDPAILITHGTFGASKSENSYFPISSIDISGRYRYVALGHFHYWLDKWIDGTLVVNPGSARQIRKSDKGARFVSVINTETWLMEKVSLPVSFKEYHDIAISITDSEQEIEEKLLRATRAHEDYSFAEVELTLYGTITYAQYSLSERVLAWKMALEENHRDLTRITWNLEHLTQISQEIMNASLTRLMVDKISDIAPQELNDLAPFLLERLQQANQNNI